MARRQLRFMTQREAEKQAMNKLLTILTIILAVAISDHEGGYRKTHRPSITEIER